MLLCMIVARPIVLTGNIVNWLGVVRYLRRLILVGGIGNHLVDSPGYIFISKYTPTLCDSINMIVVFGGARTAKHTKLRQQRLGPITRLALTLVRFQQPYAPGM